MTNIEWTDETWNPVTGCTKVSSGCRHCFAEEVAHRFWGERKFTDVRTHQDRLDAPLRWRKPRRVFVNSMSDLFHEDVPDEFIGAVWWTMSRSRAHTFQVLTKRPARMRDMLLRWAAAGQTWREGCGAILPNVWLGVSVEDQASTDARIPVLLQTPAAVRFVSMEPLLAAVDMSGHVGKRTKRHLQASVSGMLRNKSFDHLLDDEGRPLTPLDAQLRLEGMLAAGVKVIPVSLNCEGFSDQTGCPGHRMPSIDWVIVGGESGPRARPCDVAWIRSIVEQCHAARVPCFVKQLGACVQIADSPLREWPSARLISGPGGGMGRCIGLDDRKGGDPSEWPEDLRVREFPTAAVTT